MCMMEYSNCRNIRQKFTLLGEADTHNTRTHTHTHTHHTFSGHINFLGKSCYHTTGSIMLIQCMGQLYRNSHYDHTHCPTYLDVLSAAADVK